MQISRSFVTMLAVFQAAAVLSLSACHDAPRENPLDPVLTPPVELSVALNDTAGTATLTWTPYAGVQPFAEYQVLRNVSRSTVVDTLARFTALGDTSYRDTTLSPDTAYEYRVAVANTGGLAVLSEPRNLPGYHLMGLNLLPVQAEPEAGALILRWQRWVGPDFKGYEIVRRVAESVREEVVGEFVNAADTAFIDTTAQADVPYVYVLQARVADTRLVSAPREARLILPAVRLLRTEFDSRTATVTLAWTPYSGVGFRAYQVWRRHPDAVPELAREINDHMVTACVDSNLAGAIEYSYQVVVHTDRGATPQSEASSGGIHQPVAQWPLPMEVGGQVRLFYEDGRVMALVGNPGAVELLSYEPSGQLSARQVLLQWPYVSSADAGVRTVLQSLSITRLIAGERYLGLIDQQTNRLAMLTYDANGMLRWQTERLPVSSWSMPKAAQPSYAGRWSLGASGSNVAYLQTMSSAARVGFTSVEVWVDDQPRLQGDAFVEREQWDSFPPQAESGHGGLTLRTTDLGGGSFGNTQRITVAKQVRAAWQGASILAQFVAAHGRLHLGIGPDDAVYAYFHSLGIDFNRQEVFLETRSLSGTQVAANTEVLQQLTFPLIPWVPYRASLRVDATGRTVSVEHALRWYRETEPGAAYAAVADAEGWLVVAAGAKATVIESNASEQDQYSLPGLASEVRSWRRKQGSRTNTWIGVCLPEQHVVQFGNASSIVSGFSWPLSSSFVATLGSGVGQGPGELIFPLSFSPGPDDRYFVLDAGNARVQVFNRKTEYLTQWGRRGTGPGEFEFGRGSSYLDLAGSICVDDEGFIYVADPGNHRIQKFAP